MGWYDNLIFPLGKLLLPLQSNCYKQLSFNLNAAVTFTICFRTDTADGSA